jgi:TonB family protein
MILLSVWACSDADIVEPADEMGTVVEILNKDAKNDVYVVVDEQARFPGGSTAWVNFLKVNLTYPKQAVSMGVQGAVYLNFTVEKDGAIDDVMISRGIGAGCEEEAVKALLASPKWTPAKLKGEVVKSKMAIRIIFKNDNQTNLENSPKKEVTKNEGEQVFGPHEEMARFKGGTKAWVTYLKNNLQYPEEANNLGIEGAVYLGFKVSATGEIYDVKVTKGIGAGCDEEAVRLIENSKNWVPAKNVKSEPVDSRLGIRIIFKQS